MVQIRLLGGVRASDDNGVAVDVGPAKCQAVLGSTRPADRRGRVGVATRGVGLGRRPTANGGEDSAVLHHPSPQGSRSRIDRTRGRCISAHRRSAGGRRRPVPAVARHRRRRSCARGVVWPSDGGLGRRWFGARCRRARRAMARGRRSGSCPPRRAARVLGYLEAAGVVETALFRSDVADVVARVDAGEDLDRLT